MNNAYLNNLRKQLLNQYSLVSDAVSYTDLFYDPSNKSSSEYKIDISKILNKLEDYAKQYGVFFVNVYFHKYADGVEYPIFETIEILKENYGMDDLENRCVAYSKYNEFLFLKEEIFKCPICNKRAKPHKINIGYIITDNNVIAPYLKDIIYCLY